MSYDKYLEVGRDGRAPSLRQKLAHGSPLLGLFLQFSHPSLVELAGYIGYDWIFIDAEHSSISPEAVENMVRGAEHAGITPIVRTPSGEPAVIQSYLDTGAMGVLVPHLKSAEMARKIVAATKYPPLGIRGAGSKTRANNVGYRLTAPDHFAWCNEQVVVFGMLEDMEGVKALPEILKVEGLDGLVIGPTDLAGSMGMPGQKPSPGRAGGRRAHHEGDRGERQAGRPRTHQGRYRDRRRRASGEPRRPDAGRGLHADVRARRARHARPASQEVAPEGGLTIAKRRIRTTVSALQ
jgi:4-hydroxy-2-oxoheptanedioate aldolase